MAIQMPIPQWLNRYESPTDSYQRGVEYGNRVAQQERNNALAQQESVRRDQEAAVAEQYRQTQMDLQQREESRKQQEEELYTQQVARKFQAQQRVQQMLSQGVPIQKALLQNAAELGIPYTGISQLAKQDQGPFIPRFITGPDKQNYYEQRPDDFVPAKIPFKPGPVQAQPVFAPGTTNAVPGMLAVPSPTGQTMTVKDVPRQGGLSLYQRIVLLRNEKKDIAGKYGTTRGLEKALQSENPVTKKQAQADEARIKQIDDALKKIQSSTTTATPSDEGDTAAPETGTVKKYTYTKDKGLVPAE